LVKGKFVFLCPANFSETKKYNEQDFQTIAPPLFLKDIISVLIFQPARLNLYFVNLILQQPIWVNIPFEIFPFQKCCFIALFKANISCQRYSFQNLFNSQGLKTIKTDVFGILLRLKINFLEQHKSS
jgi:hypothetical protein